MNWDLIRQGLSLSVMGILTTFMSLGLLIGTILLLRYVFPAEQRKRKVVEEAQESSAQVVETVDTDADAVVAAISAAVTVQTMLAGTSDDGSMAAMGPTFVPQQRRVRRTGLGARLEEPRGRWWHAMGNNED